MIPTRRSTAAPASISTASTSSGGIGKTVLAAALARDPEIREAFPDGVFGVTVGQEPRIEALQRGLAVAAGDW